MAINRDFIGRTYEFETPYQVGRERFASSQRRSVIRTRSTTMLKPLRPPDTAT